MILTFRHRDSRSNQKYDGNVNIALSAGVPSSVLIAPQKGDITNVIQFLPNLLNCVLVGNQKDENPNKYVTDLSGILKKIIFGE